MAVAKNADDYAWERQNIFFKTIYPSLEGQCVTLTKCFMEDMTSVPNPHAARGDAKLVGKTLVAQGHAVEVPYSERKRGDLICYEYGTYGHIATQLSGGRVFEQNVNMGGVQSKIVDGERVYASRIGSENEAWRVGKNPHVYRLKTYKEGNTMAEATIETMRISETEIRGGDFNYVHSGKFDTALKAAYSGKDPNALIMEAFVASNAANYRKDKNTWRDFYNKYKDTAPLMAAKIEALEKENAELKKNSCTTDERAFLDLRKKI